MKILVVNAGSSSLKYQVIDMDNESCLCSGGVDCIGQQTSTIEHKASGKKEHIETHHFDNHTQALKVVFNLLTDKECGVINDISEISAVGHRVLHSGEDFDGSVVITAETLETMKKNIPLGPLHMPANLACVESCKSLLLNVPMVAVFYTAFHMTMPKYAYMYVIPY